MSGFVVHPDALADLEEIWEFIAADNLDAADRVAQEILDAIRGLVGFQKEGQISAPSRPNSARNGGPSGTPLCNGSLSRRW